MRNEGNKMTKCYLVAWQRIALARLAPTESRALASEVSITTEAKCLIIAHYIHVLEKLAALRSWIIASKMQAPKNSGYLALTLRKWS